MNQIILTKQSDVNQIKTYFENICRLQQESANEFPINLDEVWPLVYAGRNKAVEFLKSDFIKDVDYQTIARKVPSTNAAGFTMAKDYMLTVSCMEFFIARKVRSVFEVYRQVFHKAVAEKRQQPQVPTSFREALLLAAAQQEEIERKQALLDQSRAEVAAKEKAIAKLKPKADFADMAFTSDTLVSISQAAKILKLGFGRNTLFKKLRESGVFFCNKNEPKQRFIDAKYFNLVEGNPIPRSDGSLLIPVTVYCTQKGLAYINHLFGNGREQPALAKLS